MKMHWSFLEWLKFKLAVINFLSFLPLQVGLGQLYYQGGRGVEVDNRVSTLFVGKSQWFVLSIAEELAMAGWLHNQFIMHRCDLSSLISSLLVNASKLWEIWAFHEHLLLRTKRTCTKRTISVNLCDRKPRLTREWHGAEINSPVGCNPIRLGDTSARLSWGQTVWRANLENCRDFS